MQVIPKEKCLISPQSTELGLTELMMSWLVFLRFGWIDEHFAVIPRSKALYACGRNQTGLVAWRTPVSQKFDVFCYNESGKLFLEGTAVLSCMQFYSLKTF